MAPPAAVVSHSPPAPSSCLYFSAKFAHRESFLLLLLLPACVRRSTPQFHICSGHLGSATAFFGCIHLFLPQTESAGRRQIQQCDSGCRGDAQELAWSHPTGTDARTALPPPPRKKKKKKKPISPVKPCREEEVEAMIAAV